jgi:hypothetical protein
MTILAVVYVIGLLITLVWVALNEPVRDVTDMILACAVGLIAGLMWPIIAFVMVCGLLLSSAKTR